MIDVIRLGMDIQNITEIADAFTRGQRAFASDINPYNDAFLTWDAFEEGQKGLTTDVNPYRELLRTMLVAV